MKIDESTLLKVQFYKHCLILAEDLYKQSDPTKKTPNISDQRRRKLYGSIIFLALALESFINEISIEYCPDEFHALDKLSTPDKLDIILKLKSSTVKFTFNKTKRPFQSILKIFNYRNLFVHFKPKFKKYNHQDYNNMRQVTHQLIRTLYSDTIEAMRKVSKVLNVDNMEWLEDKKYNNF